MRRLMRRHNIHREPREQRIRLAPAHDGPPVVEKDSSGLQSATQPPITRLSRKTEAMGPGVICRKTASLKPSNMPRNARPMRRLIQPRRSRTRNSRFASSSLRAKCSWIAFSRLRASPPRHSMVEVDDDDLRPLREFLRAGDDVLLGVGIEVPFIERARVQGIEELRHFSEVQIDASASALGALRGSRRGNGFGGRAVHRVSVVICVPLRRGPHPPLGLVDPDLDQARRRHVAVFVAYVMCLTHARCELLMSSRSSASMSDGVT